MHLGILLDEERLQHEHGMIRAVCNAIVCQDHDVTCFVPEHDERDEPRKHRFPTDSAVADLGEHVHEYPVRRTRRRRIAAMNDLARVFDRHPVDVLYAVGHDTWPIAFELAGFCECPLMLDIWSAALVRRVPKHRPPESLAALVAATPAIADGLRQRVDPALVSTIPLGVAIPESPRAVLPDGEAMTSLAILGNCTDMKAYRVMLAAIDRLLDSFDTLQVFLELRGPHQHDVWRLAQRLDLLDRVSCLNDGAKFRPLLTHCDVMAIPERLGRVRSLMYDAMAAAIPTVIGDDPWLDTTGPDEAAPALHCDNRPDAWIDALSSILESPARARHLGNRARQWVQDRHTVDLQARELIATAIAATNGGVYAFPTST